MRTSKNYITTLDPLSAEDMFKLKLIKDAVFIANINRLDKKRVVLRGRKPISKIHYSYDRGGNIVGGIKNASKYDVYIYGR